MSFSGMRLLRPGVPRRPQLSDRAEIPVGPRIFRLPRSASLSRLPPLPRSSWLPRFPSLPRFVLGKRSLKFGLFLVGKCRANGATVARRVYARLSSASDSPVTDRQARNEAVLLLRK